MHAFTKIPIKTPTIPACACAENRAQRGEKKDMPKGEPLSPLSSLVLPWGRCQSHLSLDGFGFAFIVPWLIVLSLIVSSSVNGKPNIHLEYSPVPGRVSLFAVYSCLWVCKYTVVPSRWPRINIDFQLQKFWSFALEIASLQQCSDCVADSTPTPHPWPLIPPWM